MSTIVDAAPPAGSTSVVVLDSGGAMIRAWPFADTRAGRTRRGRAHAIEPVLRTSTPAIRWPAAPSQLEISAARFPAAHASTAPGTAVGVGAGPALDWFGPRAFFPPALM